MAGFYDDSKFGVINRKWFGLTKKWGGDCATGYSFNAVTHGATSVTSLAKWYPRGPIRLTKAGSFVMCTLTNASSDLHKVRVRTRGASASLGIVFNMKYTSTQHLQTVFGSAAPHLSYKGTASVTYPYVKAGEYISIQSATPVTDKATRVQNTTTGTVAFFVDYVSRFDPAGSKWDA